MRLLVLGGTQFVGRAVTTAGVAAGHDVSLFHRGRTNAALFPEVEHLLGDRDGGLETLRGRDWDACLDVSGYFPRLVRDSSELLREAVEHLVYVSTISVFADLAVPRYEDGPLATLDDEADEEMTGSSYGALKALCEQAVRETLGERATLVRPGFVAGPHDHTGRFTWWVHRAARGGEMLLPESFARAFQTIDVRDLADFLLLAATSPLPGTFNATGPVPAVTMIDVIEATAAAVDAEVQITIVDDAFLSERKLGFSDLPLWVDDPAWSAWAEVDVTRAIAAGLRFRPLEETVRATLEHAAPVAGVGLEPERERELLDAWRQR